jgi:small subunit ribosomal protein S20
MLELGIWRFDGPAFLLQLDNPALLREPPRSRRLKKMANTKSAAKRARQTLQRSVRNRSVLTHLRTLHKRARSLDKPDANHIHLLISSIDKAAKRGIIHRNAANRRKARLNKLLAGAAKK